MMQHPIDKVEWVDATTLHANSYNPNRVFTPELALLRRSILEDGWCAAIVVRDDGEIVDGFHRWGLAMNDPEVRAATDGKVPIVRFLPGKSTADQMIATVRFNRARGQHGILRMSDIVRSLQGQGLTQEEIETRLGMDDEEVIRLADVRPSPEHAGKDSFGKGWVPSKR
jgi:hypothetical protein